ncbi:hypothetical protein ASG72_12730 [Bosea sp. Leaf344]|nr:hypothetical protein ASG72_12730 [Bosea sp. Leaf344]
MMRRQAIVRLTLIGAALGVATLASSGAQAQVALPYWGFSALPSFAWTEPTLAPGGVKWDGSYARISSGFQVTSSKRLGTHAGPTIGLEAGTLKREGNFVYGVVGALEYMPAIGGYGTPGFGNVAYTRDFAGAFEVKTGVLLNENLLLYTKVGAAALNESIRYGATPFSAPFNRSDLAIRPVAKAGVEWAVTHNLTLGLEVGVVGQDLR